MTDPAGRAPTPDDVLTLNRAATVAQLLSGVLHQVNNSLQVIGGTAEMLEQQIGPADAAARSLARIRTQSVKAGAAIADVLAARTGSLLWLGALVGLWTVGSFVETIRDIFHRAYGIKATAPFWKSRLGSSAVIILSVARPAVIAEIVPTRMPKKSQIIPAPMQSENVAGSPCLIWSTTFVPS